MIVNATFKIKGTEPARLKLHRTFRGNYAQYTTIRSDSEILPRKTLKLVTTDITCRDQLIPTITANLKEFHEAYPKLILTAAGGKADISGLSREVEVLSTAMFADSVNEGFTMMASPYLVRAVVGLARYNQVKLDGRLTLTNLRQSIRDAKPGDKYYGVPSAQRIIVATITASEKGVRLNDNMLEAWQVTELKSGQGAYGHMGIDPLLRSPVKPNISVFPPAQFLKVG